MTIAHRNSRVSLSTIVAILLVHLLACAAPWTVTAPGLAAFCLLYYATLGLGITLGYHRLLAHKSYETRSSIRLLLTVFGVLALQGGPLSWVASHRAHHRFADRDGDPHSPRKGLLWAHCGWLLSVDSESPEVTNPSEFGPAVAFLERHCVCINLLAPIFVLSAASFVWDVRTVASILVWGFALRAVCVWHATWSVNSLAHRYGYRSYATKDDSRNNIFVALATFGEGWHNNHHGRPRDARHGRGRREPDATYLLIRCLARLGLAWKVHDSSRRRSS